jgi:hypothetical protein
MIVFEMTGQVNIMVPVMVGTLMANFAVGPISMSIFDIILEFKNFPYLPTLGSVNAYYQKAMDIMNRNFFYITKDARFCDIPVILDRIGYKNLTVPVV